MKFNFAVAALALSALLATDGRAVTLYSENFDVDSTANWTVNDPALSDKIADFYYDYSAIGVPAAPGGASTPRALTSRTTLVPLRALSVRRWGRSW